jgi:predicted nucleic-acid-binding protein
MVTFVDTSEFLRLFVTTEDETQLKRVKRLFERGRAGKVELVTEPHVLYETSWALEKFYNVPDAEIMDILEAVLSFGGLRVMDKELILSAVDFARETSRSFTDSYIVVSEKYIGAEDAADFGKKTRIEYGSSDKLTN